MPEPYPAAFRRQARALLDDGRTVRDVAARLGIAESCLHRWRRQRRIDQGLASGLSDADRSALAAAKQRIRDLGEGVKILRKAVTAVEEVVPQKNGSDWCRNSQVKGLGWDGCATHSVFHRRGFALALTVSVLAFDTARVAD